ncbi:hypothetical protein SARC_01857 [Sphaeroforma arctica JP610]|uniref:Fatty acid hydroxylase domain-containing protein n=1 Tax=Sphaeroforma arctica JP610 TaxID=667725 RepID=A0A0L0GAQ1_9EUKA|nr:hypothetical protein SARC_01857 [Sphaeroforma arctica JP610]KNC85981.1 hypothetical protein SARC_01857 [Sphaeroforma arctica JP610]|eukprot:XP_014159883.1 hypothetical protein SARC_01857 [Sphaeroforma arctica JP610]
MDVFGLRMEPWQGIFILSPVVTYYTSCIAFGIMDCMPSFEKYRVQPKFEEKRNKICWKDALPWVILQHAMQIFAGIMFVQFEDYSEDFDSWLAVVPKFVVAALVMDTYQYWIHRWMHINKWAFEHFHSWHHRLHCPYPIGALYNHPLEGFVLDAGSGALSVAVAGLDLRAASLFVSVSTFKTVCDHANYDLPWNPMNKLFTNNASYHDMHHQLRGFRFNFSQPYFTFWDDIMGTKKMPTRDDLVRCEKPKTAVKSVAKTETASTKSDAAKKAE